jgi:hypothetical protein
MLLLTMTLPAIIGFVPVLPGGFGTVDLTYLAIFTLFGVPPSLAAVAVLIERSITFVFATVVGALAMSYMGIKILVK